MTNTVYRTGLFALYQLTVVLGIVMMPLALAARRVGVRVPLGRLVEATGEAYENAQH
jgi:hypothetical protein